MTGPPPRRRAPALAGTLRRWFSRVAVRAAALSLAVCAALGLAAGAALAHGGSLGGAGARQLSVPTWLFLATGGGVVGASFLLASFATDREFLRAAHGWRAGVADVDAARALAALARAVGLVGLAAVVVAGFVGPAAPPSNLAILLVWVGWWAGLAMAAYLVGNAWPALNPFRTIAGLLPARTRPYPERWGTWPSVVGLLWLVWLEVVSPLADAPRLLAAVVLGYAAVTLAGAATYGEDWFARADPVSRVFAWYGRAAPLTREADGALRVRLPGSGLVAAGVHGTAADAGTDTAGGSPDGGGTDAVAGDGTALGRGEAAFVVALLWATSYDGLVATPAWRSFATRAVGAGVPAHLLYPAALLAGFFLFWGLYRLAVRNGRRRAETLLSVDELAGRFAPSLVAIAAGYHLAHFLGYFLALSPALVAALANPLGGGTPAELVLPGWFGALSIAWVLAGHLLAIWVAHAVAYELFPSRLQAVRAQYALTGAMVVYTMTSLWIVTRPYAEPPFLA